MTEQTATTADTATRIADAIATGTLDDHDEAALRSDEGLLVDGFVAWHTDDDTVVVWEGNDTDPDMNRPAEVKIARGSA